MLYYTEMPKDIVSQRGITERWHTFLSIRICVNLPHKKAVLVDLSAGLLRHTDERVSSTADTLHGVRCGVFPAIQL